MKSTLVLTDQQIAQLLSVADGSTPTAARRHAMVSLMLDAALKVSELLALGMNDLMYDAEQQVNGFTIRKSGGTASLVQLHCEAAASLGRWLEFRARVADSCPLVFCTVSQASSRHGQPGRDLSAVYVSTMVRRLGEKAGIEGLNPSALRRTAVDRFMRATGDLAATQRYARHSKRETTQRLVSWWFFDATHGVMSDQRAAASAETDHEADAQKTLAELDKLTREHDRLAAALGQIGDEIVELRAQLSSFNR